MTTHNIISSTEAMPDPETPLRHSLTENVLGIFVSTLVVSFGVVIYAKAILLTGGVVGLSLLLTYVTPIGFAAGLFLLNIPFYALAWKQNGRGFVVRSLLATILEGIFAMVGMSCLTVSSIDPIYPAIVGGALMGVGLIGLFRHGTSLGGIGILALYLQDRFGIRAGYVQMAFDATLLALSATLLPPQNLLASVLGLAVLNAIVIVHHRTDRYVGVT